MSEGLICDAKNCENWITNEHEDRDFWIQLAWANGLVDGHYCSIPCAQVGLLEMSKMTKRLKKAAG